MWLVDIPFGSNYSKGELEKVKINRVFNDGI